MSTDLVALHDLPATLLRAAGEPVPEHWHGRPLQDLGASDWRQEHLVQIAESQVGRAIRTERWTYSVRVPGTPWHQRGERPPMQAARYTEDFLYDNERDPDQLDNRIVDPDLADIRADLRRKLIAAIVAAGEPAPVIDLPPGPGPDLAVLARIPHDTTAGKPDRTAITALHSVGQSSRSAATLRFPSVVKHWADSTLRLFATWLVRDPG